MDILDLMPIKNRCALIALMIVGWTVQAVLLAGLLGRVGQGVGAVFLALWLLNLAHLHSLGLLPLVGRFWLAVVTGR